MPYKKEYNYYLQEKIIFSRATDDKSKDTSLDPIGFDLKFDKRKLEYNYYDEEGKLIHSSETIAFAFESISGLKPINILKHGPANEVIKWAEEKRKTQKDNSFKTVNVVESLTWDLNDLNRKIEAWSTDTH